MDPSIAKVSKRRRASLGTCGGTNKNGERCGNPASSDGFCYLPLHRAMGPAPEVREELLVDNAATGIERTAGISSADAGAGGVSRVTDMFNSMKQMHSDTHEMMRLMMDMHMNQATGGAGQETTGDMPVEGSDVGGQHTANDGFSTKSGLGKGETAGYAQTMKQAPVYNTATGDFADWEWRVSDWVEGSALGEEALFRAMGAKLQWQTTNGNETLREWGKKGFAIYKAMGVARRETGEPRDGWTIGDFVGKMSDIYARNTYLHKYEKYVSWEGWTPKTGATIKEVLWEYDKVWGDAGSILGGMGWELRVWIFIKKMKDHLGDKLGRDNLTAILTRVYEGAGKETGAEEGWAAAKREIVSVLQAYPGMADVVAGKGDSNGGKTGEGGRGYGGGRERGGWGGGRGHGAWGRGGNSGLGGRGLAGQIGAMSGRGGAMSGRGGAWAGRGGGRGTGGGQAASVPKWGPELAAFGGEQDGNKVWRAGQSYCFRCGGTGHTAPTCALPWNQGHYCYICGKLGHRWYDDEAWTKKAGEAGKTGK